MSSETHDVVVIGAGQAGLALPIICVAPALISSFSMPKRGQAVRGGMHMVPRAGGCWSRLPAFRPALC